MVKVPTRIVDRAATLQQCRNLKMAASAHAYVRGNTLTFYEWLDTTDGSRVPQGPPIWICGDCHAGNLRPIADTDGEVGIQIRDFDQTVVGNPAHDLIRPGLSLATAARGSDLPGVTIARMIEQMMLGYEEAFAREDPDLRGQRPEDAKPTIPLGKRFCLREKLLRLRRIVWVGLDRQREFDAFQDDGSGGREAPSVSASPSPFLSRAAFLRPPNQFPLGVMLSMSRRLELLV